MRWWLLLTTAAWFAHGLGWPLGSSPTTEKPPREEEGVARSSNEVPSELGIIALLAALGLTRMVRRRPGGKATAVQGLPGPKLSSAQWTQINSLPPDVRNCVLKKIQMSRDETPPSRETLKLIIAFCEGKRPSSLLRTTNLNPQSESDDNTATRPPPPSKDPTDPSSDNSRFQSVTTTTTTSKAPNRPGFSLPAPLKKVLNAGHFSAQAFASALTRARAPGSSVVAQPGMRVLMSAP